MIQVEVTKNLILQEDICFGTGTIEQTRGGETFTGHKVNTADMPYDATQTLAERLNDIDMQYQFIMTNVGTNPPVVPLSSILRKSTNDIIDAVGDVFTPQVIDSASNLEASYPKKLWVKILSSSLHQLKRGSAVLLEFNPLTNLPVFTFDYAAIAAAVAPLLSLGTAAVEDVGTSAGNVVQLDGSAKLPAIDGSQLTNLPIPSVTAIPIGGGCINFGATVPTGFLECDGRALARVGTYADLFAAIGTTYGAGDGSTTFQIPETRGEFIRGWDHGRGVDTGRALGSTQADAFEEHKHGTVTVRGGAGDISLPYGATGVPHNSSTGTSFASFSTAWSSTVGDTETRPRNVSAMYIIRYA